MFVRYIIPHTNNYVFVGSEDRWWDEAMNEEQFIWKKGKYRELTSEMVKVNEKNGCIYKSEVIDRALW